MTGLLEITEGPISVARAKEVRDALENQRIGLRLRLHPCFPQDEQAREILGEMSRHIAVVANVELWYWTPTSCTEILGLFLAPRILRMGFVNCLFGPSMIQALRDTRIYIMRFVFFHAFQVVGDDPKWFPLPFLAEFKPEVLGLQSISLYTEYHDQQADFGDFSLLQDWKSLERVKVWTDNAQLVQSATKLSLKEISVSQSIQRPPLSDTGLVEMAQRKDCEIQTVKIFHALPPNELSGLLDALAINTTVRELHLHCDFSTQTSSQALVRFVRANPVLQELHLGIGTFSRRPDLLDQLSMALQTTNSNLLHLTSLLDARSNTLLKALTHRNRSGRRLLAKQYQLPTSLWPRVLGRISNHPEWGPDSMHFMLRSLVSSSAVAGESVV